MKILLFLFVANRNLLTYLLRDSVYYKLNDPIKTHKSKYITIVAGDFNVKICSSKPDIIYHSTIGRYGKG